MHGTLSHWGGSIAVGEKKNDMSNKDKEKANNRHVGDTCQCPGSRNLIQE